jgi:hypothetical protein
MKLSTESIRVCIGDVIRLGAGNDEVISQANRALKELAALEANQIPVRCKDCKFKQKNYCTRYNGGYPSGLLISPNHYCGYGEPKK